MLEILKSSFSTTLILFIIFMSNTLGRILSDVSEGKTPVDALFPVLLGQSITILTLLLPLGFFLGVVFAFGRLYKDHELVVLHACGFGYRQLYAAVLWIMLPVLILIFWFSLWLSSDMKQRSVKILEEKENVHEFQQLKVGQFNKSNKNDQIFFMQSMSDDRMEIKNIIIAKQGREKDVMETAQSGRHIVDEKTGDLFLEVGPGIRYEGTAGKADYRVITFERHGILLKMKPVRMRTLDSDEKPFSQLVSSKNLRDRVELWWRISIPVTLIVLGLLAVPLSYIAPRQGRYGKIGVSLLAFIVYLNMLGLSRSALENGSIPLWINFWWVHGLFILLTIVLLLLRIRSPLLYRQGQQA